MTEKKPAHPLIPADRVNGTDVYNKEGERLGNDEALIVLSQWLEVELFLEQRPLWKLLQIGRGGRNVTRIGLEEDIKAAAQVDRFALVPELRRDTLRVEVGAVGIVNSHWLK